jgi:hypothetical protein
MQTLEVRVVTDYAKEALDKRWNKLVEGLRQRVKGLSSENFMAFYRECRESDFGQLPSSSKEPILSIKTGVQRIFIRVLAADAARRNRWKMSAVPAKELIKELRFRVEALPEDILCKLYEQTTRGSWVAHWTIGPPKAEKEMERFLGDVLQEQHLILIEKWQQPKR